MHRIHLHLFYMTQIHHSLITTPFIKYLSQLTKNGDILIVGIILLNNIPVGERLENGVKLKIASEEKDQEFSHDTVDTSKNSKVLHHTEDNSLMNYGIGLQTEIHLRNQSRFYWYYDLI